MKPLRSALVTLACVALAVPTEAQFVQYAQAGDFERAQPTLAERARKGAEEARWDVGVFKVDPRIWLRNTGYVDNVLNASDDEDAASDVTATVGAGLVAYLNLGPKVVASAYALPEYVWWQDLDDLRQERINAGAGLFGDFNRMDLEIVAETTESQRFLSSELLVPIDVLQDQAMLNVSVDVSGPFALFARATRREFGYEDSGAASPDVDLTQLDRSESILNTGFAYQPSEELRIGVGAQLSDAEFDLDGTGRSNSTTGALLEARYDGGQIDLLTSLVLREIEFDAADAEDRTEVTGRARAGWQPGHRLRLDLYGSRSLVYSALDSSTFFLESRIGLAVGSPAGLRLQMRVFAETRTNDYDTVDVTSSERSDDITSLGLVTSFLITERVLFSLRASQNDYDSNQNAFDRTVNVIRAGIELGLGASRPW